MHGSIPSDSILDSNKSIPKVIQESLFSSSSSSSSNLNSSKFSSLNVSGISFPSIFSISANEFKMSSTKLQEPFQVSDLNEMRLIQKNHIHSSPTFPLSFPNNQFSNLTMSIHKVLIASKNPVKINATASAFTKTFPNLEFSFLGVEVDSGVSNQPLTNEETFQGAKNRAKNVVEKSEDAEFVVAIEGGVEMCHLSNPPNLLCFAWAVVLSNDKEGVAKTAAFMLPPPIAELISGGMELGEADDKFFSRSNSKQKNGTVGMLTDDLITREAYYEHAICLALIPFIHPQMYKSPSMPEISSGVHV